MRFLKIFLSTLFILTITLIVWIATRPKPIRANFGFAHGPYRSDSSAFDRTKVDNVVVYNHWGLKVKKLSPTEKESLLTVLLDSASYQWGEIGTPEFKKTIVYFDHNGDEVGMTLISDEGQTYTYPSKEYQRKWGLLDRGFTQVDTLINSTDR